MNEKTAIQDLNSVNEAQNLTNQDSITILGFKATWCPQCGPQRGVVERVQTRFEGKIQVGYLDLGDTADAAEAYSVTTMPTLALFKDGEEIQRLVGFTPAPKLVATINNVLNAN